MTCRLVFWALDFVRASVYAMVPTVFSLRYGPLLTAPLCGVRVQLCFSLWSEKWTPRLRGCLCIFVL
jgi:hypothetical protein